MKWKHSKNCHYELNHNTQFPDLCHHYWCWLLGRFCLQPDRHITDSDSEWQLWLHIGRHINLPLDYNVSAPSSHHAPVSHQLEFEWPLRNPTMLYILLHRFNCSYGGKSQMNFNILFLELNIALTRFLSFLKIRQRNIH